MVWKQIIATTVLYRGRFAVFACVWFFEISWIKVTQLIVWVLDGKLKSILDTRLDVCIVGKAVWDLLAILPTKRIGWLYHYLLQITIILFKWGSLLRENDLLLLYSKPAFQQFILLLNNRLGKREGNRGYISVGIVE